MHLKMAWNQAALSFKVIHTSQIKFYHTRGVRREMTVLPRYRLSHQDIYHQPIAVKSNYKSGISKQEIKGSSEKREQMKLMKTAHTVSVSQKQPSRQREYWNYRYESELSVSLWLWNVNENCWNCRTASVNFFIYIYICCGSLLTLTTFVEHGISVILNGDACWSLGFLCSYWWLFSP